MKRILIRLGMAFVLLFTTLVGVPNMGKAASQSLAQEATWTPIVTLPVGSGDGQIAYQLGVEGAIARGPQAFAVGPDRSIYVLDSVQRRVHVVVGGVVQKMIPIPSATYPREILAAADSLYILDDDNRVLRVSYTGVLTLEYKLPPGLASHQVYRLLSRPNGKVLLWTAYYRMFDLDQLPASVDLEAGVWQKERRGRGIQSPGGDLWIGEAADLTAGQLVAGDGRKTIEVLARGLFGSMRLIGFERSRSQLYVLLEDLYDDNGHLGVELSLRRYQPDGLLNGVVRLPFEDFVISPRRSVEVAEDGTLYAMVPASAGTTIYQVELGQTYRSQIPDRAQQQALPDEAIQAAVESPTPDALASQEGGSVITASVSSLSPLTRSAVRQRAEIMADTLWTWHTIYDSFHDGRARPSDAVRPNQLTAAGGGPVADNTNFIGIPYTWGGFDSSWTRSPGGNGIWTSWSGALSVYYNKNPRELGPLIGKTNVNCGVYSNICWPSGTYQYSAGIDCSGFIAAASGLYNTTSDKPGTTVAPTGMLPLSQEGRDWRVGPTRKGEPASVPLNLQPMNYFVSTFHTFYYDYGLPDGSSVSTLEATTDGWPQAAKRHSRTWADVAANFPFYRAWWDGRSGDGPGMAKATLGADSVNYGRGQSVWYKFTTSGPRHVFLSNISGGDPDLYIYDTNFNRIGKSTSSGDDFVAVNAAGTYYARVYIYADHDDVGVNYSLDVPNPVGAGTYDNLPGSVMYSGSWVHSSNWPRTYGSTMSYTNATNATARLTFIGSRITRRYTMAPSRGDEWIYIDGEQEGLWSSYAPTPRWQVARTWEIPYGFHTIEVRAYGGNYSDLDAFVVDIGSVGVGWYDDNPSMPQIQHIGSGWAYTTAYPQAWNGTMRYSKTAEDAVTLTFYGDSITYVYTKAPSRGKAAVVIDGVDRGYVDLYAPSTQWQSSTDFDTLGLGVHTIHISVTGQKNPSATDYYVDVDMLVVNGGSGGG